MANKLQYQVKIGEENYIDFIVPLGEGRAGLLHKSEYHYDFYVVAIHTGDILWSVDRYEQYGNRVRPLSGETALYAPFQGDPEKLKVKPFSPQTQTMCAFDLASGKQLWARSMGQSKYQFMVRPTMTDAYIASINTDQEKMSILSRNDGKIVKKIKTPHFLRDGDPLLVWKDKFVTIGNIQKPKQYTIDLYNPDTEEVFVETLGFFPEKGVTETVLGINPLIVDDCLYFTIKSGYFCKFNLVEKKMTTHRLLETDISRYTENVMRQGNLLCFMITSGDQGYRCVYDMANDTCEVKAITLGSWVTQFYNGKCYWLSKNGLVEMDLLGDASSKEIPMKDWGKHVDEVFWENFSSREQWLLYEGKLLLAPRSKKQHIYTTGELLCWEL